MDLNVPAPKWPVTKLLMTLDLEKQCLNDQFRWMIPHRNNVDSRREVTGAEDCITETKVRLHVCIFQKLKFPANVK